MFREPLHGFCDLFVQRSDSVPMTPPPQKKNNKKKKNHTLIP